MSFFILSGMAYASPAVVVNGNALSFDVPPVIQNGRVLVPMRNIFGALGATVNWDSSTQTVTATEGSTFVSLVIGSTNANEGGTSVNLDVPPEIINGRTFVPLRFVGDALGCQVTWDATSQTVTISNTTSSTSTQTPSTPSSTTTAKASSSSSGTVLTPPTNLQATAISDATIELTWDASPGASSYEIFLQQGYYDKSIDTTDTTYDCSGLICGTTYQFKVKAIAGSQESDYSQVVSATTLFTQQEQQAQQQAQQDAQQQAQQQAQAQEQQQQQNMINTLNNLGSQYNSLVTELTNIYDSTNNPQGYAIAPGTTVQPSTVNTAQIKQQILQLYYQITTMETELGLSITPYPTITNYF